jgi:GTPase SAR1 family protein
MEPITMFNALVVGKIGSGKTTLVSLLANNIANEYVTIYDPIFTLVNIKSDHNYNVSYIDTIGLTGKPLYDSKYLSTVRDSTFYAHYRIQVIIICMDLTVLKNIDIQILETIQNVFPSKQGYKYHIHFKCCDSELKLQYILIKLKEFITISSFSFYNGIVEKDFEIAEKYKINVSNSDIISLRNHIRSQIVLT